MNGPAPDPLAGVNGYAVLEAAPDAMLIADRAGRILLANAQVETLFGYTRAELLGQPIELLVPERFRPGHQAQRTAFLAAPRVRPMGVGRELSGRRRDGSELPIEVSLNPIDTGEGLLIVAAIRDVTERRRTSEALTQRAAAANRAKTEFLANMSHEIRTAMTAILGYTDLLTDPEVPRAECTAYLDTIRQNGEHLLAIITNILDFSMAAEPLGCRVLLAEDGADNQRLIAHYLRKAGAEVRLADNGRVACDLVRAAEARGEPFGVVLMDMQMPELDGYQATAALRGAGYTRPIIALTAHTMESDRAKCLAAGCDDFLAKPMSRAELLDTVRRHAGRPDGRPGTAASADIQPAG